MSTTTSSGLPANTIAPAVQVIPPGSSAHTSSSRLNFPVAAIAVVAILAGLVALCIAYKFYVFMYRRRAPQTMAPLPDTRALIGGPSGALSPTAMAQMASQADLLAIGGGRSSVMALGSIADWEDEKYTKDGSSPGTNSGSNTPINQGGSPFDGHANGSRGSLSGLTRHGNMHSASSRNSVASLSTTRRGMYGANALYNGPQLRSAPSSTRLSGAPHASHSRIDIVTPLPLAPPPGSVIATGKSAIDFAPSAGIGGGLEESINLNLNTNRQFSSRNVFDSEVPSSWRDVQGLSSNGRGTSGSGSGTRTPDSTLSSGRLSSSHYNHPTPPFPINSNANRNTNGSSNGGSPHRAVFGGSAEDLRCDFDSYRRHGPPKLATGSIQHQTIPVFSGQTSPLDILQQRIVQEARRDAKMKPEVDRARRFNDANGSK